MIPFLYDVTDRSGNLVIGNATFCRNSGRFKLLKSTGEQCKDLRRFNLQEVRNAQS